VKLFNAGKTSMIGLPYSDKNYDNTLSRFHTIPERNGRADRIAISISRVSMLTRDKNSLFSFNNNFSVCLILAAFAYLLSSMFKTSVES